MLTSFTWAVVYVVEHLAGFKGKRLDAEDQFHPLRVRARVFKKKRGKMAKPKLRNVPDLCARAIPGEEIEVRVTPKAAKDGIVSDQGTIRITVTAPPENGKANGAVRSILAVALGVAPSSLILRRGQASRDKVFVYSP